MYVTGTAPASFSEGLGFCAVSTAPSIPEMVSSGIRERTCGEYNGLFNCNYYLVMYMLNIIEGRIIFKKNITMIIRPQKSKYVHPTPRVWNLYQVEARPQSSSQYSFLWLLFFSPTSLRLSISSSPLLPPAYHRLWRLHWFLKNKNIVFHYMLYFPK